MIFSSQNECNSRPDAPWTGVFLCLFGLFVFSAEAQEENSIETPEAKVEAKGEKSESGLTPTDTKKVSKEQIDDDFGSDKKDDDFGTAKDDDFGEKMDDDFGGEKDDDFGDDLPKNPGMNPDDPENLFGRKPKSSDDSDEEKKPDKDKVYASAAEAHITFLKALETEERFPSAVTCAECHPDHYREWSVSAHAYAQMSPVFNTMHAAITARTAGTNGDFCIRCHTQIGMQRDEPLFTSNLKRHPASIEGITCIVCHRVEKNYGKVSGRTHINKGDIFEPVFGPKGDAILKQTLAREDLSNKLNPIPPQPGEEERVGKKDIHAEVVKFDPISKSGFCGTCHDVNLYNGFRLEEAFTQFKNSPSSKMDHTCQDCHMGRTPGTVPEVSKIDFPERFDLLNYLRGAGARIGGDPWAVKDDDSTGQYGIETPPRKRTNHMFAGPDYSIVHPALFPHSEELREAMWEFERQIPGSETYERVGMKHLLEFKWEEGWGDPTSWFEKRILESPELEKNLPWPWDDSIARQTMREKLNNSFRNLNDIDVQRHQILRRGIQFGEFKITRNDSKGIEFALEVKNKTPGHGVPTGFDAERLMFLQVVVRDRDGRTIFLSGDRDPNGDVRDLHSAFVHHHAEKSGPWLDVWGWKEKAGLSYQKEDLTWLPDKYLFSLQSKFVVRNHRGGEREQILAVNQSVDPLPYIRPDTRPGILTARPAGARKQARIIPPLGSKWAKYKIEKDQLSGRPPYQVNFKFICQMVPVNLIKEISEFGFDYNLSPREVGKRVAYGHRVSSSPYDHDRRGGSLTIWNKTLPLSEPVSLNLEPNEAEIMAYPPPPFPYKDPSIFGGIGGGIGGLDTPPVELPSGEKDKKMTPSKLFPSDSNKDDSFEDDDEKKPEGDPKEDDSFQ